MVEQKIKVWYKGRSLSLATKFSQRSNTLLVFIHGIGCAKECFDEVFNTKLAERFSILTFDLVGFGASDKPDNFGYSMQDHAEITKLLLEKFTYKQVVLIAHSMGATIGVLLSRNLPGLACFINVEGNLIPGSHTNISRQLADQTEADFIQTGFDAFLNKLKTSDRKDFHAWANWYEKSSKVAIYRSGCSLVKWYDSGKLLKLFNMVPVTAFIYGSNSDVSSLLQRLDGVNIYDIAGSGHFMMLDNPKAFYAAVTKQLAMINNAD